MKAHPPAGITRFLERLLPDYLFEGIVGDLEEQFYNDLDSLGVKQARRKYWFGAIRFMRPEILLRNKLNLNNNVMLGNYIKIAGRNMAKRKLFSFINAFGLSIGIAFCILIYLFIQDEKSFDQFHVNKDYIYRLEEKAFDDWNDNPEDIYEYSAYLQMGLGPVVKEEIPQVQYSTRFSDGESGVVTYKDKIFTESISYADQDFFEMFTIPVLAGNREELLTDKYNVVLTPEIADKYFGTQDVVGKVIKINLWDEHQFTVSGLIAPSPTNSSLPYKIIVSQENRAYYSNNMVQWNNFSTPTFVQVYPDADMSQFKENLSSIVDKYMGEDLEEDRAEHNVPEDVNMFEYQYSSLSDIHLNTQVQWTRSSDPKYSLILGSIALLILLIACINYISLSLTTSVARKMEVGVRKSVGASRQQLVNQFSVESVVLAFLSMIIGLGLMYLFLPSFNLFTGKHISITGMEFAKIIGLSFALSLFIGLLAGSYPAFFLSAFKTTQVLKGNFTSKLKAGFTKPLVVLQFALSAFLIISSIIMYRQMEFITSKDLGFDKEQVLVVPTQLGWNQKSNRLVQRMRTRLEQEPFALGVTGTSRAFSQGWSRYGYKINGENKAAYVYAIDPSYLSVMGIELAEGRDFNEAIASDSNALIVNKALVKDMGWEDALSEYLNYREDSAGLGAPIIGVTKDFHFQSLEHDIAPVLFSINSNDVGYLTRILIKLKPDDVEASIDKIKTIWTELVPDKPFDYAFLDENVDNQYRSYQRWMSIMGLSTLFAILISCLGLFGLAGINAVNRTKEIGIRKVFGAELMTIFVLLNKQYIYFSLIAFLLAAPASWYVMTEWLSDFEYGVAITWELLLASMASVMILSLVTVSYHAIRTGSLNPADTLKHE